LSVAAVLLAGSLAFGIPTPDSEQRKIPGHVPSAALVAGPIGRLAATEPMRLAIGLPLRNSQELKDLLQRIYDPTSPNYRHFLSSEQFTDRFCPTKQDYQQVIDFARSNGWTIAATHPNRMVLDVRASVAQVEKTLGLTMRLYEHPTEPRTFYAPDSDPVFAKTLPVLHVSGLDNYVIPRPAGLQRRPTGPTGDVGGPVAQTGSAPDGSYAGNDFRGAYARGVSLNGAGQMVGLLEFDGYYPADIAAYQSQLSLSRMPPIITVTMDEFDGTPGANNVEVALDIEMASSMAPGLAAIIVYEGGPRGLGNDILSRMGTDNLARQLSASWTFPIDETTEQIFLQFAAQGQSYFNASGDNGAYSGMVDTPADDPYITIVGGTELTTTGKGGAWTGETCWNRSGGIVAATGGGISTVYEIPAWQQQVDMSSNGGSKTMRNLPDVSMVADSVWVTYNNGSSETVGGTSCSSPLWAGFMALVNQQAAGFGQPPVGFINPAIYRIGLAAGYLTNFHDITNGNNTTTSSPNAFYAVPGYDLCTGWGSPSGQSLINALAPRVQASLITNATFSLLSEGCAPGNRTVDPGETVTVNIGLKNIGAIKTTNLIVALQPDDSVRWPSAPQSYGVLNGGGAAVSRAFTFTAAGSCGTTLNATLQFSDGSANLGTLSLAMPLGQPLIVLTQNFDGATLPALPSEWTTMASNGVSAWFVSTNSRASTPAAAFADEPPNLGTEDLISPPIPIANTNAQLIFRNNFNTEVDPIDGTLAYDGGFLEIQIGTNAFVDILDAGGSFVSGGYTRTISTETNTDNPFGGHQVWAGNSGGFSTSVVNLPAGAAGQTIQLRWRFALDSGNFYGGWGWYLDDISLKDGGTCCLSSADLALAGSVSPDPVAPGQPLTYVVAVTNLGPGAAYGVTVTNLLPDGLIFASVSPGCTYTNNAVLCDAGTLAMNDATNYTFAVVPTTGTPVTNTAVIGSFTWDPDVSNNLAIASSSILSNQPPLVYVQPTNTLARSGGTALLKAIAFSVEPLAYQWLFNGAPITGENANALSLINLRPEQSGGYSVTVTNSNGTATSSVVQLTVVTTPTIQVAGFATNGTNPLLSFSTVSGLTYTLEYKDSLTDPVWIPIPPPVAGSGDSLSLQDTNAVVPPSRFYRVTAQ
jgi:uncharacterized repeat protein (TIGR01451 family)